MKNNKKTYFTVEKIRKKDYSDLREKIFSEEDLKELANKISKDICQEEIIFDLINYMTKNTYNKNYDWNLGSILQHLDFNKIIREFDKIKDKYYLYDSIGLAWIFGEFKIKHTSVIDFLYSVVNKSRNSEAWWRAAFSLENLELEDAVNLLKRSLRKTKTKNLDFYLNKLNDKKSIISILVYCNSQNIEKIIYPKIKKIFLKSHDTKELINCVWLIGRLKLIDKEIYERMIVLLKTQNYELKYYIFFSLRENVTESFKDLMEKNVLNKDPLIRKMAVRSISRIGDYSSIEKLRNLLFEEENEYVLSEITQAIYFLNNPVLRNASLIENKSNENGLIIDETDKWYADPSIYQIFSESEDPDNICFDLILRKIKENRIEVINPIDLATGTGRMVKQIAQKINYRGILYGLDINKKMCEYLYKTIKRQKMYVNKIKIINCSIDNMPKGIKQKSSFIISSFGFPSKISNKKQCLEELKAVYSKLTNKGVFVTIGWDETFNDELNMMWFKYIPDDIQATDFENWRNKRIQKTTSPRNCGLTWYKKGLCVPLKFSSLNESVYVMGHLFGRDAAEYIIQNDRIDWNMSLGITYNTKKEIGRIIEKMKNERN